MFRLMPFALLLTGCGPKLFTVQADITFANDTGFDFVESEVCGFTEAGDTCTATRGLFDGEFWEDSLIFSVFDGEGILFNAYAIDTDLDDYEQDFPDEIITADTDFDIEVVMTLDDLL